MKNYAGALDMDIVAVIGNYDTLAELTGKFDIPFHCVSHEDLSRTEHEEQVRTLIDGYQPDYVISPGTCGCSPSFVAAYPRKILNIHHSFLPAFIGARPYRQAFDRGVKLIGATAHFVTDDLDEGPIVEQDVIHVDHTFTADDTAKAGRDVGEIRAEPRPGAGTERTGVRLRQQDGGVQVKPPPGISKKRLPGSLFSLRGTHGCSGRPLTVICPCRAWLGLELRLLRLQIPRAVNCASMGPAGEPPDPACHPGGHGAAPDRACIPSSLPISCARVVDASLASLAG